MFRENILPDIPTNDRPAVRFEWANFVDRLHRQGAITDRQADSWDCPV